MKTVIIILVTLLMRALGVIFNETSYSPPLISACYHMTASFGPQPEEEGYERTGLLVAIEPETGCWNIKNPAELKNAVVLVKGGGCSFFDKALNIALAGGTAMVLGNDNPMDENLFKMPTSNSETRDVDIPCVFTTWSDWSEARAKIEGDRNGTVIATISPEGEMENDDWWVLPNLTKYGACLIFVLPAIWVILTIWDFFRRGRIANRRQRRLIRNRKRPLPEVFYSKETHNVDARVTNNSCPICLENFEERAKINRLPCEHGFHQKCIGTWITDHSDSCPICRQSVIDKLEDADRSSSRCCCCSHSKFCRFRRRGAGYSQQPLLTHLSEANNVVELGDRRSTEVQINSVAMSQHTQNQANSESLLDHDEIKYDAMAVLVPPTGDEEQERNAGLLSGYSDRAIVRLE